MRNVAAEYDLSSVSVNDPKPFYENWLGIINQGNVTPVGDVRLVAAVKHSSGAQQSSWWREIVSCPQQQGNRKQ
jgi:hypothetical protein